jgi:hypothetical protein
MFSEAVLQPRQPITDNSVQKNIDLGIKHRGTGTNGSLKFN